MALINVTVVATSTKSGLSKGALAGIILGTIAGAVTLSAFVSLLILRKHLRDRHTISRRRHSEYLTNIRRKVTCINDHCHNASPKI